MFDYAAIHKIARDLSKIGSADDLYGYVGDTLSSSLGLSSVENKRGRWWQL